MSSGAAGGSERGVKRVRGFGKLLLAPSALGLPSVCAWWTIETYLRPAVRRRVVVIFILVSKTLVTLF